MAVLLSFCDGPQVTDVRRARTLVLIGNNQSKPMMQNLLNVAAYLLKASRLYDCLYSLSVRDRKTKAVQELSGLDLHIDKARQRETLPSTRVGVWVGATISIWTFCTVQSTG
jgi:hypothetical protein